MVVHLAFLEQFSTQIAANIAKLPDLLLGFESRG
jgi:hypothetical protein